MKIAQIVCSFPPYKGGIGNSAWRLKKLIEPEIDLETFTFKQSDLGENELTDKNTYYLKPLIKMGQAAFLPQIFFKLNKFDSIILHYPFFGVMEVVWLQRLLSRKKSKLIIFYHMDVPRLSYLNQILSLPGRLLGRQLIKQADKVVVSSYDYLENSAIKNIYKKYPEKFTAIPFAIDTEKFRPEKIDYAQEKNSQVRLLFVGGLDKAHYFKGVDKLIKAVSNLRNSNWHLDIIGSGSLVPELKNLSQKLNLEAKINFGQKLSDKAFLEKYRQADILILPSINKHEAFGLVIIEAMASGTAIIASSLPGVRTVFSEGSGLKVKPGDIKDLAKKIDYLIDRPRLLVAMKKKARQEAKDKYNLNKAKESWLKLLT
ncbi:MAG: glycosyltransferase family 4 protein [Candidatus Pacebacteria bacterium]|nr:glycosyltransferase family 4 protein [Candidatus Paceibacterota bacterium]